MMFLKTVTKRKGTKRNKNQSHKKVRQKKPSINNVLPDEIELKIAEINEIDQNFELHVVHDFNNACNGKTEKAECALRHTEKWTFPKRPPLMPIHNHGTSTPALRGRKDRQAKIMSELSKIDISSTQCNFECSIRYVGIVPFLCQLK